MCCFCQSRYNWRLSCEWVRVFPTKKKTSSVLRFPTRPFPTSREEEEYFPEKEKEKILLHMKVRTTVTAFSFSSSAPPRYWTVFSVSVFFFPGPFSGNKRLLTFFFWAAPRKGGGRRIQIHISQPHPFPAPSYTKGRRKEGNRGGEGILFSSLAEMWMTLISPNGTYFFSSFRSRLNFRGEMPVSWVGGGLRGVIPGIWAY